jgi:hypothetical protein
MLSVNSCVFRVGRLLLFLGSWVLSGNPGAAEQLKFSKLLSNAQIHCLDNLLDAPDRGSEPTEKRELKAAAQVATATFGDNGRKQYIYIFKSSEFCEGNRCLTMIGELSGANGVCRPLWVSDSNGSVVLMRERDHGYRRFDSPCEARFDGQRYQLVRQACQTPVIYHSPPGAEELSFSKQLTPAQRQCLDDLLSTPDWGGAPAENEKLKGDAQVATATLGKNGRRQYIYLFENSGYCGSAGCLMMIGEVHRHGCRALYDYDSDGSFTVLRARDEGYRRFWSPCEAHYDGRQYQLLHESCPNAEVHH